MKLTLMAAQLTLAQRPTQRDLSNAPWLKERMVTVNSMVKSTETSCHAMATSLTPDQAQQGRDELAALGGRAGLTTIGLWPHMRPGAYETNNHSLSPFDVVGALCEVSRASELGVVRVWEMLRAAEALLDGVEIASTSEAGDASLSNTGAITLEKELTPVFVVEETNEVGSHESDDVITAGNTVLQDDPNEREIYPGADNKNTNQVAEVYEMASWKPVAPVPASSEGVEAASSEGVDCGAVSAVVSAFMSSKADCHQSKSGSSTTGLTVVGAVVSCMWAVVL